MPRLCAPRELDIRSVDGLREPLIAELPPRSVAAGLREAELLLRLRSVADAAGFEGIELRSLDDAPALLRLLAEADERPLASLLVTRLEPELAPNFCATSGLG